MSFCSKCGHGNRENVNFCSECGSPLIKDEYFGLDGLNSFSEILTADNLKDVEAELDYSVYSGILANISLRGAYNLNSLVESRGVNWSSLKILDKVKFIAESYVRVNYKSKGADLGNYISNVINVDDRLDDSQQIATLIHELSHHLLSEIFEEVLMYRLSVKRTLVLEAFVKFCLHSDPFNLIMDEYCAHTVEGRFIPHGYQNYGSFNMLVDQVPKSEEYKSLIKAHMVIGNTYSEDVISIIESFIDDELRQEIKAQFKRDYNYPPSYDQITLEIHEFIPEAGKVEYLSAVFSDGFRNAKKSENEKLLNEILEIFRENN